MVSYSIFGSLLSLINPVNLSIWLLGASYSIFPVNLFLKTLIFIFEGSFLFKIFVRLVDFFFYLSILPFTKNVSTIHIASLSRISFESRSSISAGTSSSFLRNKIFPTSTLCHSRFSINSYFSRLYTMAYRVVLLLIFMSLALLVYSIISSFNI